MPEHDRDINRIIRLLELDPNQVLFRSFFEYNSTMRWGISSNPSTQAAKPIAEKVEEHYPYVSVHAIYEILVHVLDNVVNYRPFGQDAKGVVLLTSNDTSLELMVSNLTDRNLPPTLNGRTYTVHDGIITVPCAERDVETGYGNGINAITKALPYIYSDLVDARSSASVSWRKLEDQVIFELSIPIPGEEELIRYRMFESRRQEEIAAFEQVEPYIFKITNPDGAPKAFEITNPAKLVVPALQRALRAYTNYPEGHSRRLFNLFDVLKTLTAYGKEASDARLDVINTIVSGESAVFAMDTLVAIEEKKGMHCDLFAEIVENYQGKEDMSLKVMVEYLASNIPPDNYSERLTELYFDLIARSMESRVELLKTLPDGRLKDKAVEKIAEADEDHMFYVCKALELVDARLQSPLVKAIVASKKVDYAYDAIACNKVSREFIPSFVEVIIQGSSDFYASEALGNKRVPKEFHQGLVDVIVQKGSAYYASLALSNNRVSEEFHELLVGVIVQNGTSDYAASALANSRVSEEFQASLVGVILKGGEAYYAANVLANSKVSRNFHQSLVEVIVKEGSTYAASSALTNSNISTVFHPVLIGVIIQDGSPIYAYDMLANANVSTAFHPQLVQCIINAKSEFYASKALSLASIQDAGLRSELSRVSKS